MQFVSERSSLQADLSNYLGEHGKKANLQVGKKLLNDKKYALPQTTERCAVLTELHWRLQQMSVPSYCLQAHLLGLCS